MKTRNQKYRYQTIVIFLIFIFLVFLSLQPVYSYNTFTSFPIGGNWKLVAEPKLERIGSFTSNGNWIVWTESKKDFNASPELAKTVRGSPAYFGIYRKNIDSNEIDTIIEPKKSGGYPWSYCLAEDGLLCTLNSNKIQQIFIPGQKPQDLYIPEDGHFYDLEYFGPEGYVLTSRVTYEKIRWRITYPLSSPDNKAKQVVKVFDSNTGFDNVSGLAWYNSLFTYTKYTKYDEPTKLCSFDINSEKETCIFSNPGFNSLIIIGIDKNFVYFLKNSNGDKIFRIELSGKHLTQQYKLPFYYQHIDLHYPLLLGRFNFNTGQFFPGLLNIETGELKEFKMNIPSDYYFDSYYGENRTSGYKTSLLLIKRRNDIRTEKIQYTINGDAEFGYLMVLLDNKIYILNDLKTVATKRSNWEPIEKNP